MRTWYGVCAATARPPIEFEDRNGAVGRSSSRLHGKLVFLVGARRSGTNWLQRILDAHPAIASVPSETALFSHGIGLLSERFQHAVLGSPRPAAVFMDRDALLDALRDFCDAVFAPFVQRPGPPPDRLVERTPDHVRHLGLIGDIYPDAYFVHIIRDGRDVARSLVSQPWGPKTVREAADEWRSAIELAHADAPKLARYREVSYEELLARPGEQIPALYEWLGIDASRELIERALREAGVKFNVDPAYDTVGSGKWAHSFTAEDVAAFEAAAGSVLASLGYAPAGTVAAERVEPPKPRRRSAKPRITFRDRGSSRHAMRTRLTDGLTTAERFIGAITQRRPQDIDGLLARTAYVRVVGDDGAREGRGEAGAELLRAAISSDDVLRGRQIMGDIHSGLPTFTFVARYADAEGRSADRVIVVGVEGDRVNRCVYYRMT